MTRQELKNKYDIPDDAIICYASKQYADRFQVYIDEERVAGTLLGDYKYTRIIPPEMDSDKDDYLIIAEKIKET